MGDVHGETVTVQPTNRGPVASPAAPVNASFVASSTPTRPPLFNAVAHHVKTATASLQSLLAVVDRLEEEFRASGDAVGALAPSPTDTESPKMANAPLSPSTSAPLISTLDALASATTRGDAELSQQLTSLRRCVAALTQELHGLSERYPNLQSSTAITAGGGSAAPQGRTPRITPTVTTPNSVRAGSSVTANMSISGHSPSAAVVVGGAVAPGSPPHRPSVETPTTSVQMQTGSFASRNGNGGGLGDSLSLASMPSSAATTPAMLATRVAGTATTTGALASTSRLMSSSPSRTAAAAQPPSTASFTSPPFVCLADRVDQMSLPASQLPSTTCAESVKKYLANCVEWPPRPRKRNVRPLTPHWHWRCGHGDGEIYLLQDSTDSSSEKASATWSENEENDAEDDGFHTPATTASRQERDDNDGSRAASLAVQRRRARSDTDEFLRRLTEESPYDMSMLRDAFYTPDTSGNHSHCHLNTSPPASQGSNSSADEEDDQHGHLSASGSASCGNDSGGVGGVGQKGKRMRSRHDDKTQRSAEIAHKNLRLGRPTILESVDALVLAQLRSDGVPLSSEMMRELRGCAPVVGDSENCSARRGGGVSKAERVKVPLVVQTSSEKNVHDETAQSAAVPNTHKGKHNQKGKAKNEGDVDFAVVLQEVRDLVHHGGTSSWSLEAGFLSTPKSFSSASPTQQCEPNGLKSSSTASLQLPRLPKTTAWFEQIDNFCTLLDDMASSASFDGSNRSHSDGNDGEEGNSNNNNLKGDAADRDVGGRVTHRSHTTTTATRERISLNGNSRRSTRASTRSSSATSSDTATAASENEFSLADDLFTSAEEAEGSERENEESNVQQQQSSQHTASVSGATNNSSPRSSSQRDVAYTASQSARLPTVYLSTANEPSIQGSSHNGDTYFTQDSIPNFSTASPPNAPSTRTATGAGRDTVARESMTASHEVSPVTSFEDFWLERGDTSWSGSPANEREEGTRTSENTGLRSSWEQGEEETSRGVATTTAIAPEGRAGESGLRSVPVTRVSRSSASNTPVGSSLAQRNHRQEQQRRRNLQRGRGSFLRERYLYVLENNGEVSATRSRPSIHAEGKTKPKGKSGEGLAKDSSPFKQRVDASPDTTRLLNYRSAARELRALCALMRTDLTLLTTLQELSKLLTAAPASSFTTVVASPVLSAVQSQTTQEDQLTRSQLSESLAAATQLLVSVQEQQIMQSRIQKESSVRGVTQDDNKRSSETPILSAASASAKSTTMTPLLLSSQHPVSALGYAPLLAQFRSASNPADLDHTSNHGTGEEDLSAQEKATQLAQYIVTVAPYLLAWQLPPSATAEASTSVSSDASRLLPLSVWTYVEAVTTELLEEARKLNALYELFVQLIVGTTTTMGTMNDKVICGGADECLLHHIRHNGRAMFACTNTGVAGARLSIDNGLEKFVTPVSAHLLRSFDRLDVRHLLSNVFHDVHLSDVKARRRAQKQQQQQQQLRLSSSPSPVSRPPPPHPVTAQQRRAGTAVEGGGGTAAGRDDDEVIDSFALPPGTLSSSPALRRGSGMQWSMRDAEQQSAQARRTPVRRASRANTRNENDNDDSNEEEPRRTDDSDATRNVQSGNASRSTNRSTSTGSEPRRVMIEGFVRYLTVGMEHLRGGSGRGGRSSEEDDRGGSEGGNSPSKTSPHGHQQRHHSGLTLDVPHTSSLLKEQDGRFEKATSNIALIRAVNGDFLTETLVEDVLRVRGGARAFAELRAVDMSKRHYFNAHAAVFSMQLTPSSLTTALSGNAARAPLTTVLQCRWQPVFQSTMCFCPVTRRRCLDPLVCGALLICSPLPPEDVLYTSPDQDNALTNINSNNATRDVPNLAASPLPPDSSPLPIPATIRALRNGLERAMAVRALGAGRSTPGPSSRRVEAGREATATPPQTTGAGATGTATTPAAASSSTPSPPLPTSAAPQVTRAATASPARVEASSSHFSPIFLRRTLPLPERVVMPRILTQISTSLYAASSTVAAASEGINEEEVNEAVPSEGDARMPEAARRALRAVTLPLDASPITRNLLLSPDTTQSRWLNPPTLLECGHVVSYKTYLDLRTNARRTSRNAAAPTTMVVCCPYCSKVTPAKDALTLSYLF